MSAETGYNGWKNYETWAVALWLDNDQGTYNYWRERADEIIDETRAVADGPLDAGRPRYWTHQEATRFTLADELKERHEEGAECWEGDREASVFTDLLRAALSDVDWNEIAEHILSETDPATFEPDGEVKPA